MSLNNQDNIQEPSLNSQKDIINPPEVKSIRDVPVAELRRNSHLYARKIYSPHTFHAERKQLFLECFIQTGDITKSARAAGVDRRTVYGHLELDEEFRQAFTDAQDEKVDSLEARVYELGMTSKSNTIDRLAYLRAFRPSRWNPQHTINVNRVTSHVDLAGSVGEFIDTEPLP